MSVPLSLACERYDRTEALRDGRVRINGVDLTYLPQTVEETFFRMARFKEFDASEMSLSSYVISLSKGEPFVGIPVFPSRFFRHSGIYVATASSIREPQDLVGKRVGLMEYQLTANVWIRGILDEHYGVPADSVTYFVGGLHDPGRIEKISLDLPPSIHLNSIPEGSTLNDMLLRGELDAIYSPRVPRSFMEGNPAVSRLFPDYRSAEENYFRETNVFPIMHVVVLRREVYEENRWLARSLMDAFSEAKRLCEENFTETATLRYTLPWLLDDFDRTVSALGDDYWSYGLEKNRHVLEKFLDYSFAQGLSPRLLSPEELFAPETLEVKRV